MNKSVLIMVDGYKYPHHKLRKIDSDEKGEDGTKTTTN